MHEIIYMTCHRHPRQGRENIVCRLNKSLYGLKQASHVIKSVGFQQSKTNYSLFTRQNNSSFTALLIYDLRGWCSFDRKWFDRNSARVKDCLLQQFRIKDLGDLKYFLGIEFSRSKVGIYLSQRKYALDILQGMRLTGARPDKFPIEQYLKLTPDNEELLKDPVKYGRLVGRLIYLTITRPDIAFSVRTLSQYIQDPRKLHWDAAIWVLNTSKDHQDKDSYCHPKANWQLIAT